MTTATACDPGSYQDALAGLRDTASGEDRALLLELMAVEAGRAAVTARGVVPADSRDSTLAWEMTAALMRQLAAAQRGLVLHMVGDWDADHWDSTSEWKDVAMAGTSREFTAAFRLVYDDILKDLERQDESERAAAVDVDPGDPATTALARLAQAARAISEADW
ncbi:MAG TPA: hypothetical protein VGD91_02690 [Trebonia sp.]